MPVLQVKTFRQKAGKVETSHYKVTVSRFRARMAIPMNYNTLKGEMRVEGYPDVSNWFNAKYKSILTYKWETFEKQEIFNSFINYNLLFYLRKRIQLLFKEWSDQLFHFFIHFFNINEYKLFLFYLA